MEQNPRQLYLGKADPLVLGACIEIGIPYVFDLEQDPTKIIKTGNTVKVSGLEGVVEVLDMRRD